MSLSLEISVISQPHRLTEFCNPSIIKKIIFGAFGSVPDGLGELHLFFPGPLGLVQAEWEGCWRLKGSLCNLQIWSFFSK